MTGRVRRAFARLTGGQLGAIIGASVAVLILVTDIILGPSAKQHSWQVALVGLVAGFGAAIVGARALARVRSSTMSPEPRPTIEDRLAQLAESVKVSARLMEGLSAEIDAQAVFTRKLQADAASAEALAEANQEAANAFLKMIDSELSGSEKRIRRDSVIIGFAGLVFGSAVTLVVTLLAHPVH